VTRTNVPLRTPSRSPHTAAVTRLVLLALVVLAFSAGAAQARADDHGGGGGEVRVAGSCGSGAVASLRLRSRDSSIEVRFRLRQTRGRGVWRIAIVHERRVSARATRRTTRVDDSFELERSFRDLPGSDTVAVHAWGPSGLGCRATATLPG
jgi:hypothetical protein